MTPDGYFDCKGCGASWSSTQLCHCAGCHRSFTGIEGFDRHLAVTCGKKTCTPENPCDGKTRTHYPIGRTVFCLPGEVQGEVHAGPDGRIRTASSVPPRPGRSRRKDEDGGS